MHWRGVERVWLPGWIRDRDGVLERIAAAVAGAEPVEAPAVAEVPVAALAVPELVEGPAVVRGVISSGSATGVTDFVPADDSVIASQSVLNNMTMAKPAIIRIAAGVLEVEGPTAMERLVSTVAKRFGYSRIGDGKRREIQQVVSEAFTIVDGFAWPVGSDPASFDGIRRTVASADRAITEISPQEVANAFELVLREAMSSTREELFKEAAGVLGYSRMTDTARTRLTKVLDPLVASGRILDDGQRLRLA
jgi:hypothetical protein